MRKDYALTPEQKIDAREALKILSGSGISLADCARRAVEGKRAIKRITVREAADLFLREKLDKRPATVAWYLSRINLLCENLGDRLIDEVTRAEFREWLTSENLRAAARAGRVRAAKALWRWAIAQEPQLAVNDVTGGLPTQSSRQGQEIGFLTVPECQRIMDGAGKYQYALALMLFAGIRPEEVRSPDKPPLCWKHVNADEKIIRIPGDIAKTGRARLIEGLPDTIWEWLPYSHDGKSFRIPTRSKALRIPTTSVFPRPPYSHEVESPPNPDDPICPYLAQQAVRHAKTLAGYDADNPWPADGLRHTFATYYMAAKNDPGMCAMIMGHEGNPTMLHRHYRAIATKSAALKFWEISPYSHEVV